MDILGQALRLRINWLQTLCSTNYILSYRGQFDFIWVINDYECDAK